MKRKGALFTALVFALVFAGCATTVNMRVLRTPKMDIAGIKRITLRPFETSDNSSLQREIAGYLTNEVNNRLRGIDYYTLIDASMVDQYRRSGETLANHIDAQFGGKILSITVQDSEERQKRKDKEGNEFYITVYRRQVTLVFNYGFLRTRV
jgi:hypothetical protein